MPIDHHYVQVENDGPGKKIANVHQTDPDGDEVYLQKTVTWSPSDATDAGGMEVVDGHARVDQRAEVSADATAIWTSATAAGTALTLDVTGYSVAVFSIVEVGAFSTGQIAFEGSANGGSDWHQLDGISPNSNGQESQYFAGNSADASWHYWFNVAGLTDIRFRLWVPLDAGGTSMAVVARATTGAAPFSIVSSRSYIPEGNDATLGTTTDSEATDNGTVVAILKRIRTLLNGGLPAALGAGGGLKVDGSGTALPVTDSALSTTNTDLGATNETAPASDTASSGLNGRLQRVAQRLTSLIALLPASLGQKTMANSMAVTLASDQSTLSTSAVQSGTWNITNVSGTVSLPTGAATAAKQPALGTAGTSSADVISVQGVSSGTPLPITDYESELAISVGLTSLRDKLVAQRYTILADSIADGLAAFWTSTTANGGTAAATGGEGLIQTSANAAGSAQIVSSSPAYYPGQVHWLNSAIRLGDTGSAGNVRRWGAYTVSGTTPQEGFYYELSGTTLNAVVVKGGSATATASGSWSRNASAPFTLDTNYHSFEIRWTANSVWFYIDNVLRHAVSGTISPLTSTLNFPMAISNVNTSGATNRVIAVRNIGLGRFGTPERAAVASDWRLNTVPKKYMVTVVLTPGAATAGTNLMGVRKTAANPDCYISRIRCHVYHAAAGVATPVGWKRATTVGGGSQVTAADLPKLDTSAGTATLEVRTGAVTVGAEANQYLLTHTAPVAPAPAANAGSGYTDEWVATDRSEMIRLTGDEGLILELQAAGDTDNRYHVTICWEEA